jgi:hypothetical protein
LMPPAGSFYASGGQRVSTLCDPFNFLGVPLASFVTI